MKKEDLDKINEIVDAQRKSLSDARKEIYKILDQSIEADQKTLDKEFEQVLSLIRKATYADPTDAGPNPRFRISDISIYKIVR